MNQSQMFIESLGDAIQELVQQLGGPKRVGAELWPEKSLRDASNQLQNCINPEHAQKLSLEQIDFLFAMARKQSVHVVPQYIAGEFGYQITPIEPEDEKAALMREFNESVARHEQIVARLEKLK